MNTAKIYARVFDYSREEGAPDGALSFTLEWKRIAGAAGGGKASVTIDGIGHDGGLANSLRHALAAQISTPADKIKPWHIVGLG